MSPGLDGGGLFSRVYENEARRPDPLLWIEKKLGARLWSKQREIVESVRDNRLTAVQSANGCGKSFDAAAIASWWCAADPGADRFCLLTAPNATLVRTVLWAELRRHYERGQLPGELLGSEWRLNGRLLALAKKTSDFLDEGRAESGFAGLHRPAGVLVVIDEASGVENWLWNAISGLTTGESCRVLAVGNPLRPDSRFAQVCQPGSGWNRIKISAFDSPNFTDEEVSPELSAALPGEVWVDELRATFGENSPAYQARVLGEFAEAADDGLIEAGWVRNAHEFEALPAEGDPVTFGVDVARSGSDSTVIVRAQCELCRVVHEAKGADLMETSGAVARLLEDAPGAIAIVDEVGVGGGVIDRLKELGLNVRGFVAGARARRPERFANLRAETYWQLREMLREGVLDLDPEDEELSAELLSLRWSLDSAGRTRIESKDDARKRGISSPDRADALCLALGAGSQPVMPVVFGQGGSLTADLLTMPRDSW